MKFAIEWTRDRLGIVALLAALLVATLHRAEGGDLFPASALSSPPAQQLGVEVGFYFIDYRVERIEAQLDEMTSRLQAAPRYVMFYRDLGRPFWRPLCDVIRDHGAVPVVSMELWRWRDAERNQLPAIARGDWDPYFRTWAGDARKYGDPVFLRFGFEMNGDWFSWSGQPETFIAAWRRIHGIFEEVGADNVRWVFSPNNVSVPDREENSIPKYWPGDDYVDWLGVDGYNFGDHHDQWHTWQMFDEVFAQVLDLYAKERPLLPVMISEFGCAPGEPGQRAAWIQDASLAIARRPQIKAAIWFHYDKRREGEPNWSFWDDEAEVRAFRSGFFPGFTTER